MKTIEIIKSNNILLKQIIAKHQSVLDSGNYENREGLFSLFKFFWNSDFSNLHMLNFYKEYLAKSIDIINLIEKKIYELRHHYGEKDELKSISTNYFKSVENTLKTAWNPNFPKNDIMDRFQSINEKILVIENELFSIINNYNEDVRRINRNISAPSQSKFYSGQQQLELIELNGGLSKLDLKSQ